MTTYEFYRAFLKEVQPLYSTHEAASITRMVFESFANLSLADILKNPDLAMPEKEKKAIEHCLKELHTHKPIQYIIGEAWFYHLLFKVSPAVLIPRPETEELVKEAIGFLKNITKPLVCEIGTGSGCISISMKKNMPEATITAIDVSEAAISMAKENAASNDTAIHFIQSDFLSATEWNQLEKYDVIISNPPYIPEKEKNELDKNVVLFEPSIALFVPDNRPLIFYEKIADFGKLHLKEKGKVFVETHENYAEEVKMLFIKKGYQSEIKEDAFGKKRMVIAF